MRCPDAVVGRLAGAAGIAASALVLLAGSVLAADPSPTSAAAGDPRSAGEGPGLVGDPAWAVGIVLLIAILSLLASLAWVRMTGGRGPEPRR